MFLILKIQHRSSSSSWDETSRNLKNDDVQGVDIWTKMIKIEIDWNNNRRHFTLKLLLTYLKSDYDTSDLIVIS